MNTTFHSHARHHADANSIIFEEDLDSDGELTVVSVLKSQHIRDDLQFHED